MKRKIKKTEITCDICKDIVERDGVALKSYNTLKGKSTDYIDFSMFWSRKKDTYSNEFHICDQCLHDLGTLVKRLRKEEDKAATIEELKKEVENGCKF